MLLQSIGLLVSGLDFGMGTAVVKYVADRHAVGDGRGVARTIATALAFYAGLGVLTAAVFIGALVAVWDSLDIPPDDYELAIAMVALATVGMLVGGLPLAVFRHVLSGLHRMDVANGVLAVQLAARAALIVAVLLLDFGILAVAIVDTIAVLAGGVACLVYSRRLLPGLDMHLSDVRMADLRPMLRFSLQVFVLGAAALVILQTDNLIIGAYLSLTAVTLYAGAYRFVQFTRDVTGAFMHATVPEAARANTLADRQRLQDLLIRGTKYANFVVLLVAVPGIILAEPLLVFWGGPAFREATGVLQILLAGLIVNANHFMIMGILTGMGRVGRLAAYHVAWACLNIGLSILLVQRYGMAGVAVGTVAPIVALEALYVRAGLQEIGVTAKAFIRLAVVPPALGAAIGAAIIGIGFVSVDGLSDAAQVVLWGSLFCALHCLLFWRLATTEDERIRGRRTLRGVLGLLRRPDRELPS